MKKLTAILVVMILCVALAGADDFKYNVKTDDTLKTAQTNFHKIMGALWHGPLEDKNTDAVAEKMPELLKYRDAIMKANLPEEFAHNLDAISKTAVKFSAAVDVLDKTVKANGSSDEIYNAFSKMHDYYRDLKTMTLALNDVRSKFHDAMHPLIHEAAEKKDLKAIADGTDDMLKWAKLILQVNTGKGGKIEEASAGLVKACEELKKLCEAKDEKAILDGLKKVHDCYHIISEE